MSDSFEETTPPTDPVEQEETSSPASLKPFEPFPMESLPPAFATIMSICAKSIGCDPTYLILPALAVCAAAIGNGFRIRLKAGWAEAICLWTMIIGKSGTMKSPAFEFVIAPFVQLQLAAFRRFAELSAAYDERTRLAGMDKRRGKPKQGDSAEGKQAATPELERPVCRRFYCNDVTVEALAVKLAENPRGLLVARDEVAGLIRSFDQYKSGKGGDVAHWLEFHRGASVIIDRKTTDRTTIVIPRALVSIAGGIQPHTLRRVLGDEHVENGLAARFMMAFPPAVAKSWNDDGIDEVVTGAWGQIVEGLVRMCDEVFENGEDTPRELSLTPEAKHLWVNYYNEHARAQVEVDDELAAAFAKLEGGTARLAAIFHLIGHVCRDPHCKDPLQISAATMQMAIDTSGWFARESARIYSILKESSDEKTCRELTELIERRGKPVTARDICKGTRRFANSAGAEKALNALVAAGIGDWRARPTGAKGGMPTREFVLRAPADRATARKGSVGSGGIGGSGGSGGEGLGDVEAKQRREEKLSQELFPHLYASKPAQQSDHGAPKTPGTPDTPVTPNTRETTSSPQMVEGDA